MTIHATKTTYRQGDVLTIEVGPDAVTRDHRETPREAGRIVLALGKSSMHRHVIRVPGVCMLSSEGADDRLLRVDVDAADLVVEGGEIAPGQPRHGTIPIPRGTYGVVIQREWTGGEVRDVHD